MEEKNNKLIKLFNYLNKNNYYFSELLPDNISKNNIEFKILFPKPDVHYIILFQEIQ